MQIAPGEAPDSDTASFWVSGLCSPWRSFGQRAKALVEAKRSGTPGRVQAVINTAFGELYAETGEAPEHAEVLALRGGYVLGSIPAGVQLLTAGVDVQKSRLYYVVRGWGVNSESWLVAHGELWGSTEHETVWQMLGDLVAQGVGQMTIKRMFIDSGFNTSAVYSFARQYRGRAYATKGHLKLDKPVKAVSIDINTRGKTIKQGLTLWHVDASYFKEWVHSRIQWPADQPGGFHLPSNATEDYCKQLIAEQRIVRPSGRVDWIRVSKDNHYLDCEVLAAAAAHTLAVHNLRPKERRPRREQPQEQTAQPRTQDEPRASSWINYDRRGGWLRR